MVERLESRKDPWISRTLSNKIQTPVVGLDENNTVDKLINHHCHCWNHNVISEIFLPEDARLITEIPLGLIAKEDQIAWNFTLNGLHSVKVYTISINML